MTNQSNTTVLPKRAEILTDAITYVSKDRNATHGNPEDNFGLIADYWTTYLRGREGQPIDAKDVAVMCILIKVARIRSSPQHRDNWVDIAGYAGCGGEVANAI